MRKFIVLLVIIGACLLSIATSCKAQEPSIEVDIAVIATGIQLMSNSPKIYAVNISPSDAYTQLSDDWKTDNPGRINKADAIVYQDGLPFTYVVIFTEAPQQQQLPQGN